MSMAGASTYHDRSLRRIARTLDGKRHRFDNEERSHAKEMTFLEAREPAPTSAVMRLTAQYAPFMKHNRKVADFDKVAHKL